MLDAIAHCPRLHSLAMTCGNSWPVTSLQRFPRLKTLRLATAIYDYTYGIPRMQDPISYTSITTLSLHNTSSFSTFISECLSWCTFPSLRVFSVQGYKSDELPYSSLFQFIHLHPTILEANIDTLEELRIRIESVLKLIDGTGTWVSGQGAEYLGNKVCKIDLLPDTWTSEIYPPDIVPNHPMLCQSSRFGALIYVRKHPFGTRRLGLHSLDIDAHPSICMVYLIPSTPSTMAETTTARWNY